MMCEVCFYNRIQVGPKDSFGKGQKAPVDIHDLLRLCWLIIILDPCVIKPIMLN